MKIPNAPAACKVVITACPPAKYAESDDLAVRYILGRFEVSPSLARTLAGLAMLGGYA